MEACDGLDHGSRDRAHPHHAAGAVRDHRRALGRVVERAVEHYRRELFLADLNAAYARLRADPVAWRDELAERALWETTLADGLDDW